MDYKNEMQVRFLNKSANEGFARVAAVSFLSQLDLTVEDMADIKTAISEAVTNAIVHGYENMVGFVTMHLGYNDETIEITISDYGRGIEDIEKARKPLYTTRPELERSGMGFTVMETFMDTVTVKSSLGYGTTVIMRKNIM